MNHLNEAYKPYDFLSTPFFFYHYEDYIECFVIYSLMTILSFFFASGQYDSITKSSPSRNYVFDTPE